MSDESIESKRMPLHVQILIAMVIGTLIGVWANPGEIPIDTKIQGAVIEDSGSVTLLETVLLEDGTEQEIYSSRYDTQLDFVRSFPELAAQVNENQSTAVDVSEGRVRFQSGVRDVSVTWQRKHNGNPIVTTFSTESVEDLAPFWRQIAEQHPPGIAGKIVTVSKAIGDLFLRLLKMVTVPLILTSLITGVTGLGGQGRFGRMFGRTITYYVVTSLLAITTGLLLVNIIRPGIGAVLPGGGKTLEPADQSLPEIIHEQLLRLIPTNPFAAIAGGEFLSIISFAIMFGMFINFVGGEHGKRLKDFFESAFAVMMRMTGFVISLAPVGVAAFMVYATATQGLSVFQTLAWYMITVFLALLIHATIILPTIVRLFGKRNPLAYFQSMSPALLTAFSTASSNATLPLTMNCVENRAGVSNATSSFVLPLGATINMDGTALYEVVAVMFIAQATPGFELSIAQQLTVAFTALIASVGAAGIPHAGLVMMAIVLQAVGLPLEAQGIIIAVDRILDMCRTAVNVWSDSCGCAVVEASVGDTAALS